MSAQNSESGNVFFLIFLAIAMFAALSYAVFQGSRSSMSSLTSDQARLAAQEIIAYGDALAKTVQTLRLRGCSETQLDFGQDVWKSHGGTVFQPTGHNALAPADGCSVFKIGNGNAKPVIFPMTYLYNWPGIGGGNGELGHGLIIKIMQPGVGNTAKEDIVYRLYAVKKEICMKINEMMGIGTISDAPPVIIPSNAVQYSGVFTESVDFSDTTGLYTGKTALCYGRDYSGDTLYFFHRVLLAR